MRKLLRALILATMLSLTISTTALADEYNGGGSDGKKGGGTYLDGASYAKTGYLIYASGEDGKAIGGRVLFATTYATQLPGSRHGYPLSKDLRTRFGDEFKQMVTGVEWGKPPFSEDGYTNEPYIREWLSSPYGDCASGVGWVLKNYLGFSDDMIKTFVAENQYLNIEPVLWCGLYTNGLTKEGYYNQVYTTHTAQVFCGTAYTWAKM